MRVLLSLAFLTIATVRSADYGVDCSFPIHNEEFSCGDLLGDRKQIYDDFMQGCRDYYGRQGSRCDVTEKERFEMSRRQPQSMVNYTETGFKKLRAPQELQDLLFDYFNKNFGKQTQEAWPKGNIYVNHWKAPTYMMNVEDSSLRGGGFGLKRKIWDLAKPIIEEWTGMEVEPTSQYGIRMYSDGAILSPHVDRLPLVSSCIINVAQDIEEDWPLEVYDRHDRAVNVSMVPGDMVLYESGSLMHGRPFAMKGNYYANIFIHFQPTGRPLNDKTNAYLDKLDDFLPPYLVPGSPEIENWIARNPQGWKKPAPAANIQQMAAPEPNKAAARGDVDVINKIAATNRRSLHKRDPNGWQPIHEAARGGHRDVLEALVKHGADVNARTGSDGRGQSVLNLAYDFLPEGHEALDFLVQQGAQNIGPDEL